MYCISSIVKGISIGVLGAYGNIHNEIMLPYDHF